MDTQDSGVPVQSVSGIGFWPLSWWQIALALAMIAHLKFALDWAMFPSTAGRPFLENLRNFDNFLLQMPLVSAHFLAVGAAMGLTINAIKKTVDWRLVFSWLLLVPVATLLGLFILWNCMTNFYGIFENSPFLEWAYRVYFGFSPIKLPVLVSILVLAAKFGGKASWPLSVVVAAAGLVASYLFFFIWYGPTFHWDPYTAYLMVLDL